MGAYDAARPRCRRDHRQRAHRVRFRHPTHAARAVQLRLLQGSPVHQGQEPDRSGYRHAQDGRGGRASRPRGVRLLNTSPTWDRSCSTLQASRDGTSAVEWINSGSLMKRANFVADMVSEIERPGVSDIIQRVRASGASPEAAVDTVSTCRSGCSQGRDPRRTCRARICSR